MYLVMMNLPAKLTTFLTNQFLSKGIEVYLGKDEEKVAKLLKEKGPALLMTEINHFNNPWLKFLIRLKEYEKKDGEVFKLILMTDKKERNFIQTTLFLNTIGYISGKCEQHDLMSKLEKIIKNNQLHHDQRKHQRVTPGEKDEIIMTLTIPKIPNPITAKVINLSISGVALQLKNDIKSYGISDKEQLRAQLVLNRKMAVSSLIVIFSRDNILGGQFVEPTDNFLNIVGTYIIECLSNYIELICLSIFSYTNGILLMRLFMKPQIFLQIYQWYFNFEITCEVTNHLADRNYTFPSVCRIVISLFPRSAV